MYVIKAIQIPLLLFILCIQFSNETGQSSLVKRKRLWIQEHEKELENTTVSSTVASGSTRIDSLGLSTPEKQRKISGSSSLRQSDLSERTSTQDNSLTSETPTNSWPAPSQPPKEISSQRPTLTQTASESKSTMENNYTIKFINQAPFKTSIRANEKIKTYQIIYNMKPKSTSQRKANNDLITKSINFIYVNEESEPDSIPPEFNATPAISCQILSWSPQGLLMKSLIEWTQVFIPAGTRLYFGCNSFQNIFQFRYACATFNLFIQKELMQFSTEHNEYLYLVRLIMLNASSSQIHLPLYCSLFLLQDPNIRTKKTIQIIPLYFMFTTISYLKQNDEFERRNLLKSIVKYSYFRMKNNENFLQKEWNFLREYLQVSPDAHPKKEQLKTLIFHFDISTVMFIYREMKQNQKTKSFFEQVWNACKSCYCNNITNTYLKNQSDLKIASPAAFMLNSFYTAACKLYQMEFTNLLIKDSWSSIDELLVKYSELKRDFDFIGIEFRYRLLNRNDFKLLKNGFGSIRMKLIEKLSNRINISKSFIVDLGNFINELKYFMTVKCVLYCMDLCQESKETNDENCLATNYENYLETLDSIIEIGKCLNTIYQTITLIGIEIEELEMVIKTPKKSHKMTSINELGQFISDIIKTNQITKLLLLKFQIIVENPQYLEKDFCQLPNHLTRFQFTNIGALLDEILLENKEEIIESVFTDDKYKQIRKLWSINNDTLLNLLSIEEKKIFIRSFSTFLILYNQ